MKYHFTFPQPHQHIIRIAIEQPAQATPAEFRLSTWRPGRYERGPYGENICDVHAKTASGKALKVVKTESHRWQVEASPDEAFTLHYGYFANVRDAGSSSFGHDHIYINGVNLLMYRPEKLDEACDISLDLPQGYEIACGLPRTGNTLHATDFHQAVDAPLMASANMQHMSFDVSGTIHHLWFLGEAKPDWSRLQDHFTRFGKAQVDLFGGFPADEYHYLFFIHNSHFYHGVEHFNSTVITLGPGYKLMKPELYEELLGVSCHELFHTWNVKAIRPADMQPYNYDGPNYSQLHYVTEGVTTYYGDLMLLKGGVFDLDTYLRVFNNSILKRHYANQGRNHISLEQASFDSWLNGYKPGTPNRKISFYTKGALAAFILDYLIRASTGNARSLDTVMREMYERFGKTGKGYTRQDYREIAEKHAGRSLGRYFEQVISKTAALEPALQDAAEYFGFEFAPRVFAKRHEKVFGLQFDKSKDLATVQQIHEGSPADVAGMSIGDEIVAINGLKVKKKNLGMQFGYFGTKDPVQLHVFRRGTLMEFTLQADEAYQGELYMLAPMQNPSDFQLKNRKAWISVTKMEKA